MIISTREESCRRTVKPHRYQQGATARAFRTATDSALCNNSCDMRNIRVLKAKLLHFLHHAMMAQSTEVFHNNHECLQVICLAKLSRGLRAG